MPEAAEKLITCGRCGYEWNWLANQRSRCPKCAIYLDLKAIKEFYRDKSCDLTITPESIAAFDEAMKGKVGDLIKSGRRRS